MIHNRILIAISLMLSGLVQASQPVYTKQAREELNQFILGAATVAGSTMLLGDCINSGVLQGIGLGTASGTACAVVTHSSSWLLAWILEHAAREALVSSLGQQCFWQSLSRSNVFEAANNVNSLETFAWISSWLTYLAYNQKESEVEKTAPVNRTVSHVYVAPNMHTPTPPAPQPKQQ